MTTAAIYVRVSADERNNSLDAQLDRLYAYAKKNNMSIYKEYEEIISGAAKNRKQFMQMIQDAQLKCFDTILVTNLSRFSRGTLVSVLTILTELQEQNIKVIAIDQNFDTSTIMGRALLNMTVLLSELEREMASERSKAGYQHAKDMGHCVFCPPFGYKSVDKILTEVPEEAEIIRQIFKDRESGMILDDLHKKYGKPMGTIYNILKNPVYKTGEFYIKGKLYLTVKPILEEEKC